MSDYLPNAYDRGADDDRPSAGVAAFDVAPELFPDERAERRHRTN